RTLTSRNSRDAIGVFLPTLRDLSRRVPSTSQYSSFDEPSVQPTICGRYLRSVPSMYSQDFSVSSTFASASILTMDKPPDSVFVLVSLSSPSFVLPRAARGRKEVGVSACFILVAALQRCECCCHNTAESAASI